MFSLYHAIKAGLFNPEYQNIALDYRALYTDPLKANMTMIHEQCHNVLSHTTDYGLATINLFELKNIAKVEYKFRFEELVKCIMSRQLVVQESTATFIEMQYLRENRGKNFVEVYVTQNLPADYQERFLALKDIFNLSKKYQANFTTKISKLAMHNGIRQRFVRNNFKTLEDLEELIYKDQESPDYRFERMLENILKRPGILNKEDLEICDICGITYYDDTSKEDVKDFMNPLLEYTTTDFRFKIEDVKDGKQINEIVLDSADKLLITNLNPNITTSSEVLFNTEDFLHYSDIFTAMLIGILDSKIEDTELFEKAFNRKFEANILAFTSQINKYIYLAPVDEISRLIDTDLNNVPLIVKWGLYKPNSKINLFNCKKLPNVVLYNTPTDLIGSFKEVNIQSRLKYLHIGSSMDHPFQTLLIKDNNDVIHMLNTVAVGTRAIRENLNNILETGGTSDFALQKNSINLAWNIWNGLESNYDWFSNLLPVA